MIRVLAALAFVLAIAVAGCGPSSFRKEVTETRLVAPASAVPPQNAHAAASADAGAQAMGFRWQLPEGWVQVPPRPMRIATFAVAGNKDIDCYLTSLTGNAGGVEANVNRWRGQVGLPPATPEEMAQMPRIEMLGRQAPLVEAAGEFRGMDGEARPGWVLLGAVVDLDGEMLFAKMTGPEQAVRAEKDRFVAFCNSIEAVAR